MTIAEYLESVKERLLTDASIASFEIVRERSTTADGHLRARLGMTNQQKLEFSEYVRRSADGTIDVITYSYHWTDAADNLIRRWDNTPHFPNLAGFPHHVHDGSEENVKPGKNVNIFLVLDEIAQSR